MVPTVERVVRATQKTERMMRLRASCLLSFLDAPGFRLAVRSASLSLTFLLIIFYLKCFLHAPGMELFVATIFAAYCVTI